MLKEDEAVVIAIEEHKDGFQERNLDDFKKVSAFGFVGLDTDFNENELEVYLDLGIRKIPKGEYKIIKIWE
jgi:hypothetical protein